MATIMGWAWKIAALGVFLALMTTGTTIRLPEEVLGVRIPQSVRNVVDRGAGVGDYAQKTQAIFRDIASKLR